MFQNDRGENFLEDFTKNLTSKLQVNMRTLLRLKWHLTVILQMTINRSVYGCSTALCRIYEERGVGVALPSKTPETEPRVNQAQKK